MFIVALFHVPRKTQMSWFKPGQPMAKSGCVFGERVKQGISWH